MLNVIFYSLMGGIFSLIAGVLLLRREKTAQAMARYATPFAAGVLLAAALTDLIPESLHNSTHEPSIVLTWVLLGMLGFFMLERFLRFFHHHHEHGGKEKSNNSLIIIGDTLHNALDGVTIGAAFLINTPTGIVATIAIAAHEIPQEIGDFGLLLKNGMKRSRVLLVNVLSALATTILAATTYAIGDTNSLPLAELLAITAGFFIYVAASDIIPEIHEEKSRTKIDWRPWLLLLGAAFVLFVSPVAHQYVDKENESEHSIEKLEQENNVCTNQSAQSDTYSSCASTVE
jgi:zinc and cadmium transporter